MCHLVDYVPGAEFASKASVAARRCSQTITLGSEWRIVIAPVSAVRPYVLSNLLQS